MVIRTALEDRLLKFAEEARSAATLVTPSRELDELLRKARKAEMLARRPTDEPSKIRTVHTVRPRIY